MAGAPFAGWSRNAGYPLAIRLWTIELAAARFCSAPTWMTQVPGRPDVGTLTAGSAAAAAGLDVAAGEGAAGCGASAGGAVGGGSGLVRGVACFGLST